jgi:dienelactone hydrolase
MRALDAIAAGKWVLSQGVDPGSLYLMGGSQGGWTVLRTMTDTKFFNQYNRMFRAGISLYPVCLTGGKHGRWYAPNLGPYNGIVAVFTAGEDTATPISQCNRDIFTSAQLWKHYPGATHGFDIEFLGRLGQNTDGECVRALNIYNRFAVCKNDAVTQDMRDKVRSMVVMLTPYPHLLEKNR